MDNIYRSVYSKYYFHIPAIFICMFIFTASTNAEQHLNYALEEVIVTAQKREQSLQDAAIAISVLDTDALAQIGISELGSLAEGAIPSLRIQPLGSASSNLVMAMRGNGPADAAEFTREASVAVYLDGVYLGRSQGLGMELADLQRIEVLRGPQGTLFGRNAIGGAVNLVSKTPTGKFDFKQTLTHGRFDALHSVTRINLPQFAGVSAKIDYLHSERDGWVNNTAPDESDFGAYNKDGGRLSLRWEANDTVVLDYQYGLSEVKTTQNYFQFYEDNIGIFGRESERQSTTRRPITPLEPTVLKQSGHALTVTWEASDSLLIKSISAYREMEEDVSNNFAGTLYFNGLNFSSDTEQDQFTQELQIIGTLDRLEWVSGFYYYKEDVNHTQQNIFTLDIFGILTGTPLAPITPPTTFDALGLGATSPLRRVNADAESIATYGQATWNPAILDDRLHFTAGLRYTNDDRSGTRNEAGFSQFDLSTEHIDYQITLSYAWTDELASYIKWSTAHKAGGVNSKSASFSPFNEEEAETLEIGLKSELWDKRLRLNAAVFFTDYDGMQLDFNDPLVPTIVETINASNTVQVDGLEIEVTVAPIERLLVGLSYTYLHGDMPLQPNPLANGMLRSFQLAQTPQHAGALTLDYVFSPWRFGVLSAHLDMTSTSEYAYVAHGGFRQDSYTLLNARLTLADINLGHDKGAFTISVWGRNLADVEYVVYAFPVGSVAVAQAFGSPRTAGIDVSYKFN